jgi:hypothetical protein
MEFEEQVKELRSRLLELNEQESKLEVENGQLAARLERICSKIK